MATVRRRAVRGTQLNEPMALPGGGLHVEELRPTPERARYHARIAATDIRCTATAKGTRGALPYYHATTHGKSGCQQTSLRGQRQECLARLRRMSGAYSGRFPGCPGPEAVLGRLGDGRAPGGSTGFDVQASRPRSAGELGEVNRSGYYSVALIAKVTSLAHQAQRGALPRQCESGKKTRPGFWITPASAYGYLTPGGVAADGRACGPIAAHTRSESVMTTVKSGREARGWISSRVVHIARPGLPPSWPLGCLATTS